jgi:hypothetical protein
MRDSDAAAPKGYRSLSVLLLNEEMVWQGHFTQNPDYHGPEPSCQVADKLAEDLRGAMRKARAGEAPPA